MWWHTRRNQIWSFGKNGRVHLNRRRRQLSRLLAAEVCASAVVMLDTPCYEVVWRVLATHSIRQFPPHHFPTHASPCAITFLLESTHFYSPLGCPPHLGLHQVIWHLGRCISEQVKSMSVTISYSTPNGHLSLASLNLTPVSRSLF